MLGSLKAEYLLFWLLNIILMVAYEAGWLPQGGWVGDAPMEYLSQTVCILFTILIIPFSLRVFNITVVRKVRNLPLMQALVCYRRWSEIRLALLCAASLLNLAVYYATLNTTGLFCAGMVFVAVFFCVPSRKQVLSELDLQETKLDV